MEEIPLLSPLISAGPNRGINNCRAHKIFVKYGIVECSKLKIKKLFSGPNLKTVFTKNQAA